MSDAIWNILVEDLAFPEGPCFAPDGRLWWVELASGHLGVWEDGKRGRVEVGGRPNGIAIDNAGKIWFCDQGLNAVRQHDPETGKTKIIVDHINGEPLGKPNDLVFDSKGNLLFTCSNDARTEPVGYVCCLSPEGQLTIIADGLYFPNGLALTPDGTHLVVAETYRQRLLQAVWNKEVKTLAQLDELAQTSGPVGPDGMAFDNEGNLWVAVFGQSQINRFDANGNLTGILPTPGVKPTNLAFDPSGQLGLILTEVESKTLLSCLEWKTAISAEL